MRASGQAGEESAVELSTTAAADLVATLAVMNRDALSHSGQRRGGSKNQRKAELRCRVDQAALVACVQCQRFVQVADALDGTALVLHQVQHRQPGYQLGHQHAAIGSSTVEVVAGFRLAIHLANPEA